MLRLGSRGDLGPSVSAVVPAVFQHGLAAEPASLQIVLEPGEAPFYRRAELAPVFYDDVVFGFKAADELMTANIFPVFPETHALKHGIAVNAYFHFFSFFAKLCRAAHGRAYVIVQLPVQRAAARR